MTTLFDNVREHVTARMAAEQYGLVIGRNGRARCPWHNDHKPDLTFYDKNGKCYCHACHNGGDSIDLVSQMFSLSPLDAARKLTDDFHLLEPTDIAYTRRKHKQTLLECAIENVRKAESELNDCDDRFARNGYGMYSGDIENNRRCANQWLSLKRMEAELAKRGELPSNWYTKPPERKRSEFDIRWDELCKQKHEAEKELLDLQKQAVSVCELWDNQSFVKALANLAHAEEELDVMWAELEETI